MNPPTVLLMLKAPVEGTVKTRLAREIGATAATRVYRQLVEHQMTQLPADWPAHICFAPADARTVMQEWLGDGARYSAQCDGDLGDRLTEAATLHFQGTDAPLIFIGGDCPALTRQVFAQVAALLGANDVVVVPATDGGYCLLAMRKLVPGIFQSISWSTASVMTETRAQLAESGLAWTEMETLEDVDDRASLERAVAAFPHLQIAETPQ